MSITDHLFQEHAVYSQEDLQRAMLHADQGELTSGNIAKQLCSIYVGKKPILEPIRDGSIPMDGVSAKFRFNYVGLLSAGNCLFLVLPKYYIPFDSQHITDELAIKKLKATLAAIRQYAKEPNHNDQATGFEYETGDEGNANRVELISFLLNDYADNDLYQSSTRIRERNGDGEIDWSRTIDRYLPYPTSHDIDGDIAYAYMDYESGRNACSNETIIRRIHAAVITEISRYLHRTMLDHILDLPHAEPSNESPSEIGDTEMLTRLLRSELATQFVTRKRLLIQALIRYLELDSVSQESALLAQGTCSFELVWEDICKKLFDDDERLHPITPTAWAFNDPPNWSDASSDISVAGKLPDSVDEISGLWKHVTHSLADDEGSNNDADLLPDVVTQTEDDRIFIVDAKYYVPWYMTGSAKRKASVSSAPSAKDVTKQYFYYFGLADALHKRICGNAFVMPGQIPLESEQQTQGTTNLLALRGITYLPFMVPLAKRLYGTSVGGAIPIYEMHPEAAIRFYLDEHCVFHKLASRQLSAMFG